jgi:starch-binding outer membrane protein, SusD/RagB family
MKIKIFKVRSAIALLTLMLLFACEDYVQVDLPDTQLTSETVFKDKTTATAALMDVYAKVRENSFLSGRATGLSTVMGLYTDELQLYNGATSFASGFYNNSLVASDPQVTFWWSSAYNIIYGANAVIEGLQGSAEIAQEDKDILIGEALFIRAVMHFYLENLYSGVPYITTTNHTVNTNPVRMASSEVYQKIISDLNEAIILLPVDYVTADRTRVNRLAVQALLARVSLYDGDSALAADAASAVINNTALYDDETPQDIFLKDSQSTIWQLSPASQGRNTYEGQTFILTSGPPSFVSLRNTVLNSFEPGDQRRSYWIGQVDGDGGPWFFINKYKERTNTSSSVEYSIALRLAEMYLIRSEARLKQGDVIGALDDINHIRANAGLDALTITDSSLLLQAILQERRIEFLNEHGHRFFDLKRLSMLDQELTAVKPGWNTSDSQLPIPVTELLLNPNLSPQNEGY